MQKILFALGNRDIELELASKLKNQYKISGAVLRKGQILNAVREIKPDILILRETLEGNENIRDIVMKIRMDYAYVRIIFLAGHRKVGDPLLSLMVTYGVYDILSGGAVTVGDILGLVYSKNDYKDINHLQPNILFDDKDAPVFTMPETVNIERKSVVMSDISNSSEITQEMKLQMEREIESKMKVKLREEFNKDYQILLQKGQLQEQEIRQKLEEEYKNKLIERQGRIKREVEAELQEKVAIEINNYKREVEEKLREKEAILRAKMESKINVIKKQSAELRSKYEAEEYEQSIRAKLESELRAEMEAERSNLEQNIKEEYESSKQRELAKMKKELLSRVEDEGRKALALKEEQLKSEIERKKKEELEKEKAVLRAKTRSEIEKEKEELEKKKMAEVEAFKQSLEAEKNKEVEEIQSQIKQKQIELRKKIEKDIEEKAKIEFNKAKADMQRSMKQKEDSLREQMEAKIKKIIEENNQNSKNEAQLRAELENKIKSRLEKEKESKIKAIEEKNDRVLQQKKQELLESLKLQASKELEERTKHIEEKNSKELEAVKIKLEKEKEDEIAKYKKQLESKTISEIQKLELVKNEELKRIEDEKVKELNNIEERNRAELRRLEDIRKRELEEVERRRREEAKILEQRKQEEIMIIKQNSEAQLRKIEEESNRRIREAEARLAKEKEDFINTESQFNMKGNQKIISFIGGKNGVGTTTIAINVATELAMKGSKVLYIELNNQTPSVGYWYQMDMDQYGLEEALKAIKSNRYGEIYKNVIKSKNLKDGEYGKFYKNLPDGLEFLLFSKQETLLKRERMTIERGDLGELYFYLMQHFGYEYIIIDLRIDEEDELAVSSLLFSTKIYSVITQDIASLAYLKHRLLRIEKAGVKVERKNAYIVNKLDEKGSKLNLKEIKSWVESKNVYSCPNAHIDVMNSIYEGVPTIISTKNKQYKSAISSIVEDISKKNK